MHNNMLSVNIYNTTINLKKNTKKQKQKKQNMQLHWNLSDQMNAKGNTTYSP